MTRTMRGYLGALLAVIALSTASVYAQVYTELYNFNWHKEGANPANPAVLAQGQDGNLYSTLQTQLSGDGSVYNWSVAGSALSQIYGFTGLDGNAPQSGLSLGIDGSFYGTTETGGSAGYGTVFKISPGGALTELYSFTNGTDGAYPWAPPIEGPDGSIYGVTYNGTNQGQAYKITSAGVFSVIATLPSKTQAPMIFGTDGNLYGTTPYGGDFNRGTVFQLTTKGKLKLIHSFGVDGTLPGGSVLQAADGRLYGLTPWGGTYGQGIVYSMSLSGGTYKVLHNFQNIEASNPSTALVQGSDKFLYGVAPSGGVNDQGSIFKINTTGKAFAVLYSFQTATGDTPMGNLTLHTNGTIYGTTNHGGTTYSGYGVLYSFNAGLKPFASLVIIWSGKVGTLVGIIGQGFSKATGVNFGSGPGTFTVINDNYMIASPTTGATTGQVTVLEPSGNLVTPQTFKVTPTITSISPTSGPAGTSVVIKGTSLTQASTMTLSGVQATFTINSDTQITAVVPAGAITGKFKVTTKGGTATSTAKFTVQ